MCFFDSPIGRCEAIRELVLLDETQQECACEHGCPADIDCPLKGWFTKQSGVSDPASLPHRPAGWVRRPMKALAHPPAPEIRRQPQPQPRSEAFVFS